MRATIRGSEIEFQDFECGTPVVWIHGFPLSSALFERQLDIPNARHIVPDLPGFGKSPARDAVTMSDYADDVLALIDHCNIEHAVFAGVSMGGYVVFDILKRYADRASGAILIDTRESADTNEARKGRYDSITRVGKEGISPVVDAMFPKMLTESTRENNRQLAGFTREMMESSSAEGVTAALRAMAERPDSASLLPDLKIPVLVVAGADDTITPPTDAARMAKAIIDSLLLVMPHAAHLSNLEQPDLFNTAVEAFLRSRIGRAAASHGLRR
jgi:pimeloyl-ACP methyl ester carboxylesterase